MSKLVFLGRLSSLVVALLATATFGPIIGFNVYINALKAQFNLSAITGKYKVHSTINNL